MGGVTSRTGGGQAVTWRGSPMGGTVTAATILSDKAV